MGAYAGESRGKKIARAYAYHLAAGLLGPRRGSAKAVALCGPEAKDIDLVRAFGITGRPEDLLLCDVEPAGLEVAREKWPGVRTHLGWMHEAPMRGIDLAVLDFCGSVESDASRKAIEAAASASRGRNTVFVVTYLRGRERKSSGVARSAELTRVARFRRDLRRLVENGELPKSAAESVAMNMARSLTAFALLCNAIGVPPFTPGRQGHEHVREMQPVLVNHCTIEYVSDRSPMGMTVCSKMRLFDAKRVKVPNDLHRWGNSVPAVLVAAEWLEKLGVDPCLGLGISRGTLAAWRAHRTMGTYAA